MFMVMFVGIGQATSGSTNTSSTDNSYHIIHISKATAVTLTLLITFIMIGLSRTTTAYSPLVQRSFIHLRTTTTRNRTFIQSTSTTSSTTIETEKNPSNQKKGRILVLGGTGYLGQEVCHKARQEGYSVVTLSRRGTPATSNSKNKNNSNNGIDYRKGDARQKESIVKIIQEGDICGIVHCIGLLFDTPSGLGSYNVYVSGSKSLPDNGSTYDAITRQTAFHAIDAIIEYYNEQQQSRNDTTTASEAFPIPFCFTSAAEAGWPDVLGGKQIESIMPEFIKRYMIAKRAVENKLLSSTPPNIIRPIIVRPSLIYSPDQFTSLPAVTSFTILNQLGLPFVDRPVTVDALATAIVKSITDTSVRGIQRYPQIDALSGSDGSSTTKSNR
jgi:nucleoside-diphosphate-sugar epimerase